jgi:hypothetical protein
MFFRSPPSAGPDTLPFPLEISPGAMNQIKAKAFGGRDGETGIPEDVLPPYMRQPGIGPVKGRPR